MALAMCPLWRAFGRARRSLRAVDAGGAERAKRSAPGRKLSRRQSRSLVSDHPDAQSAGCRLDLVERRETVFRDQLLKPLRLPRFCVGGPGPEEMRDPDAV